VAGLLNLFVIVIGLGIFSGLVVRFIPMHPIIKSLLSLFVLLLTFLYIFQFFGIVSAPMLPHVTFFH